MSELIGQSIGRYHILEQLGEGGMATVYKAYDTRLERDVAIKIIRVDQFPPAMLGTILKRFEREAKSLAKLSHPNIVHINDYGEYEGVPYLVMDYLPGRTLKEKLGSQIPWSDAVRLLLPVARALAYAHREGIIHRDVKPNNIIMTRSGDPMLTDFGIAKILDIHDTQTLTGSGVGIGTPEYMSPEQALGQEIDARSDVYALGAVFYEMVTGKRPFTADTPMAVVLKHISDPLPRPNSYVPDLPETVEHVLIKALAKKPEDRYADMDDLAAALEEISVRKDMVKSGAAEKAALGTTLPAKLPGKSSVWYKRLYIGVGILVLSALYLVWMFMGGQPSIPQPATTTYKPATTTYTVTSSSTAKIGIVTPTVSATSTPLLGWVTGFAEPVLKAIADRPPTYHDDFSNPQSGWYVGKTPGDNPVTRIDGKKEYFEGEYRIVANAATSEYPMICSGVRDENVGRYEDFVAEFDVRFVSGENGDWEIAFHMTDIGQYSFEMSHGGSVGFYKCSPQTGTGCEEIAISAGNPLHTYAWNHILLIVRGARMAAYVNGPPILYVEDKSYVDAFGIGYFSLNSCNAGYNPIETRWDNFKVWDISNHP